MNVQCTDCFYQIDISSLSVTCSLHLEILWTSEMVGLMAEGRGMHPILARGDIVANWESFDIASAPEVITTISRTSSPATGTTVPSIC